MFLRNTLFPHVSRQAPKTPKNVPYYRYLIRDLDKKKNSINLVLLINQGANLCDLRTVILLSVIIKSSVLVYYHCITHTINF